MAEFQTLLPPNATPLERALDQSAAHQLEAIPRLIRSSANPDTIPAAWLPWLAWAWRVENWDTDWTETQKRAAIKASFAIHRKKGTIGAIREALKALGITLNIVEWFEDTPRRAPYTFRITMTPDDDGISDSEMASLMAIVETTKNARSHLSSVDVGTNNQARCLSGGATNYALVLEIESPDGHVDNQACAFSGGATDYALILEIGRA